MGASIVYQNTVLISFLCVLTELAAELFSEAQRGRSLDLLHYDKAAVVSRNTCASPCSLILALLYLERLKTYNPDYLKKVAPSELFLISLVFESNRFKAYEVNV